MNSIAEKIVETIKYLPDQQILEILAFAESVKKRQTGIMKAEHEKSGERKAKLLGCFSQFQIDMTAFKFDREEANARR